jgi:hypothetical protein
MRYAVPLQSEFHERTEQPAISGKGQSNMFVKQYPKFCKREDIRREFISLQHELSSTMPHAKVIKEDIDNSYAHLQFDVSTSDEVLLERIMYKRGFVKV